MCFRLFDVEGSQGEGTTSLLRIQRYQIELQVRMVVRWRCTWLFSRGNSGTFEMTMDCGERRNAWDCGPQVLAQPAPVV